MRASKTGHLVLYGLVILWVLDHTVTNCSWSWGILHPGVKRWRTLGDWIQWLSFVCGTKGANLWVGCGPTIMYYEVFKVQMSLVTKGFQQGDEGFWIQLWILQGANAKKYRPSSLCQYLHCSISNNWRLELLRHPENNLLLACGFLIMPTYPKHLCLPVKMHRMIIALWEYITIVQ